MLLPARTMQIKDGHRRVNPTVHLRLNAQATSITKAIPIWSQASFTPSSEFSMSFRSSVHDWRCLFELTNVSFLYRSFRLANVFDIHHAVVVAHLRLEESRRPDQVAELRISVVYRRERAVVGDILTQAA